MTGGMMASLGSKTKGDEEEEKEKPVDRETVEKTMIHTMQIMDDKHLGTLPPESVVTAVNNSAESCRLSESEVRGLIGSISPEGEKGEVQFVDYVRTWVPILFELRASPALSPFLGDLEELDLPQVDINNLEALFPLLPGSGASSGDKMSGEGSRR